MRGRFWCGLHTTALALLPLVFGGHTRVAENEPKIITLSCDGMLTPTYGVVISDPTQQPHDPNTATIHYELVCKASS